jgi:hypothetical protein
VFKILISLKQLPVYFSYGINSKENFSKRLQTSSLQAIGEGSDLLILLFSTIINLFF